MESKSDKNNLTTPSSSPPSSPSTTSVNKLPLELETSEEWTILSVSSSVEEDGTKKEEILAEKDDQSDIEEIEETEDNEANFNSMDTGSILSALRLSHHDSLLDEPKLRRRESIGSTCEGMESSYEGSTGFDCRRSFSSNSPLETSMVTSGDELADDVDLSPGYRTYTHTPNLVVNIKLNLMVCFAITAVIFLGIGNYIGWSTNWKRQKAMIALNNNHITKLRTLQDELVACMQSQSKEPDMPSQNDLKICHENADYWKEKFDKLFRENKGLKDVLVETQKHYYSTGHHNDIFSPQDCASGAVAEEFHKLKLDLFLKQMEHLKVLKSYTEFQYQEKLSRERLQALEKENSELKAKLIEEEDDDKIIASTLEGRISQLEMENSRLKRRVNRERMSDESVTPSTSSPMSPAIQELESKVRHLSDENNELKEALRQIVTQVELAADYSIPTGQASPDTEKSDSDYSTSSKSSSGSNLGDTDDLRIDSLRQRINSMVQENEDLKSIIARLRWSETPSNDFNENDRNGAATDDSSSHPDDVSSLEYQIQELQELLSSEREEVNKWKSLYEDVAIKMETSVQNSNDRRSGDRNSKFYDWLYDINFPDLVGNGFSSGSRLLVDAMKTILEKAEEARKTIPNDMARKINLTMSTLGEFQEAMWEKWAEIRQMEYFTELSGPSSSDYQKTMIEMTELLVNSLRKLQEIGTKFATNTKPIPQKIDKLTAKMTKIMENLEIKWQQNKEKLFKAGYVDLTEDKDLDSKADDIDNWYINRARSRRNNHFYPEREGERSRSWLFRRAQDREAQRTKGDHEFVGRGL